jgi:hypothetical protein
MKSLPVGAEFFQADKRSDMAKPIIAFHRFSEVSKVKGSREQQAFTMNKVTGPSNTNNVRFYYI